MTSTRCLHAATDYDSASRYRLIEGDAPLMEELFGGNNGAATVVTPAAGDKRPREEGAEGSDDCEKVVAPQRALELKGNDDVGIVVHNDKTSYGLRRCEFSNSLYFLTRGTDTVLEKTNYSFELHRIRPRVESLASQFPPSSLLTLDEIESVNNNTGIVRKNTSHHTFEAVVAASLLSRKEVADFLTKWGAVIFNGCVRLIHPQLKAEILDAILTAVNGHHRWSLDRFQPEELLDRLADVFPRFIVKAVLSTVSEPLSASPSDDNDQEDKENIDPALRRFTKTTVLRQLALNMLDPLVTGVPTSTTQNFLDFMARYRKKVIMITNTSWLWSTLQSSSALAPKSSSSHDTLEVTDDEIAAWLQGFAYTANATTTVKAAEIHYLPHDSLSYVVGDRLKALFERKVKWNAPDLRAYITPILEPGATFEHSVGRYCREQRSSDRSIPSTYTLA